MDQTIPRLKLQPSATNGKVRIIKPADPEKLAAYLKEKAEVEARRVSKHKKFGYSLYD